MLASAAAKKERMAQVDEDGVDFKSVIDGSMHRFTPEKSMQIQHGLGADIMFAFDELTTLVDTRRYQEESVERTHRWARRCLVEHDRLTTERTHRPLQSLWGVVQGAQYEDLRRQAARGLVELSAEAEKDGRRGFGGFGIGGALEKENLGTIAGGSAMSCPTTSPATCWGSPSRMTCSPASPPVQTPSTVSPRPGLPAVAVSTPWTGD
ncbi:Queuine tRNA-ribosyltransferase catalytic subunit 1 [Corynebacterium variabile]